MNIEEFRDYCLSFPGSEEKTPFEKFFHGKHSFLAFYVNGKMFCYFEIDSSTGALSKCNPERLRNCLRPMNRSYRHITAIQNIGSA